MDFTLNDEQEAINGLAGRILGDTCAPDRLRVLEQDPSWSWIAQDAWIELAKADLLGIALPDDVGGGGYGFLEACLVLQQQGLHVAPVPVLPTIVLGALPVAEFGSGGQRKRLLPGVIDGSTILTAGLAEANEGIAARPATTAVAAGAGYRLDGEKVLVPAAHLASTIVVPASVDSAVGVFLVPAAAPGVTVEPGETITGEPLSTVRLDGVELGPDDVLGDPSAGRDILEWIVQRAVAALCMVQVGVCDGALGLTGRYVAEREQFGSKIGTFQAVAQRIADAYIDTEAIRLTALQAAWRLSEGVPADDELHIAKFWAADGAHRVVHAAQHLHGGIGMDLDYPVHRYFRWTKAIEFTLGSATDHLRLLGRRIAASPA